MEHVLVSGGTGVTGSALVRHLLDKGARVTLLARPNSPRMHFLPLEHPGLEVIECPLGNYASLASKLDFRPDAFLHLAWEGSRGKEKVNNRDNMPMQALNIMHDLDAVELCRGLECPVFLATGTQAEYGPQAGPAREEMPCKPENGYGAAKLCAMAMSRILCRNYGIRHIWARLFSVYGPWDATESLIDNSIKALKKGISPAYTPGEQIWDYLYAFDAAEALCLLAEKGRDGLIYNVASGNARPLAEYINIIHKVINPKIAPRLGAIPYRSGQPMRLEADISRLAAHTGFRPRFSFEEGIAEIADAMPNSTLKKRATA